MIHKESLRSQVLDYLLEQIRNDQLQPNQVISLAALSRKLEISVTPIREALNQLSRSGLIEAAPNRGFILKPLNLNEAMEIYPIISTLEGMVLAQTNYGEHEIKKLSQLNNRFSKAKSIKEAVLADNDFHDQLLTPLNNETLNRIISDLKVRILIYEFRFQDDRARFSKSAEEHEVLLQALEKGENTVAQKLLKKHWDNSIQFIQKKMTS